MTTTNLFRRLDAEWPALAASAAARAATRRWACTEPSLSVFHDPAQMLDRCRMRADQARAHGLLAAVLRVADGDSLAQQTLLQAVLPGLAALTRRARKAGWCRPGGMWADSGELDQELLGLACERIAALAGQDLGWPAMTIVDQVWRRARMADAQHRRHHHRHTNLDPVVVDEAFPACEEAWEQQMARLLCDAVRWGTLPAGDGAVIYTTRVIGVPTSEVAERLELDVRAVLQRRGRAERRLARLWTAAA